MASTSSKVYEIVTQQIIDQLKSGTIPWQKPWTTPGILPQNLESKRPYSGINLFILLMLGYQIPYFLTFKQAKRFGGQVIKGSKGIPITFYKLYTVKNKQTGEDEEIPMARYYYVFNASQVSGIEDKLPDLQQPNAEHSPIELAEQIVASMANAPRIEHVHDSAYFNHTDDVLNIPQASWFDSTESYYAALFHELVHATGHHTRLKRREADEHRNFGDEAYSFEELVAEIGSAFLCAHAGISKPVIDNSAAYIEGWLEAFDNDRKMLVSAAAKAQKAVEYILGTNQQNEVAA